MARKRMHPIVEGAARAVAEIGGKALRRAVDSVMEDGQRAAEEIQRDIMNARSHVGGDSTIDMPFEVREVPPEEDIMERVRRRERAARDPKDQETDDPPPSGETLEDIEELTNLRDAETFLRHGWMLLAELADNDDEVYPKENAKELEELLADLRDRIEEREGV